MQSRDLNLKNLGNGSLLFVASLVFGLASVGVASPPSDTPYVPNPSTRFVDDDANLVVESVDGRGLVVDVLKDESQPQIDEVLLSTAGEGFLRRVTGVRVRPDGTYYVTTEQATLEEAFDELTVSGGGSISVAGAPSAERKTDADAKVGISTSWQYSKTVTIDPSAKVDASITLKPDLYFDMDLRISGAKLEYAYVAVDGNMKAVADLGLRIGKDVKVTGQAKLTPTGIPLGTILVGGIPVKISLDVYVGLSGAVGAQGTAGLRAEANGWVKAGVQYTNGRWVPLSGNNFSFNLSPQTSFETFASAEVYVKGRIATRMLGAAGPYIDLSTPKIRLTPTRDGNGRRVLEIRPGIVAAVGFDIPLVDMDLANFQVVEVWFSPKRIPF